MNRIKKNITVRFFSIESGGKLLETFAPVFNASKLNNNSRILNIKSKKHLIKISDEYDFSSVSAYAVTVVRERNTWQTKATSDGVITGLSLNQGIIGDPYFFFVIPSKKILLGFTSGPSGSLIAVGKTMLDQFNSDRLEEVKLSLIPKEKEFSVLRELPSYNNLHFRINSSSLVDISDDAPKLIKELSTAPYIENNMQLALHFEINEATEHLLTKNDVVEIVDFLSDHHGCSVLKVRGTNDDGKTVSLDFGNAFVNYKTEVQTKYQFIEEETAVEVLKAAFSDYLCSSFSV
jgi:hypothetical protein